MQPKWNGKIHNVDLNGCLMPFTNHRLFFMQIDGCDDYFLPLFSDVKSLNSVMEHLKCSDFCVKQIVDVDEFLDSISGANLRVMFDPKIISDHHTKWLEIVKVGEEYKFEENEHESS